jgi:hypothetical protein
MYTSNSFSYEEEHGTLYHFTCPGKEQELEHICGEK